jgi:nitrate/nitrite transporter NarK
MTPKQAIWIMAVEVVLWIPMSVFLVFFSGRFSPREVGMFALINIMVCVPTLILVYKTWISKMR